MSRLTLEERTMTKSELHALLDRLGATLDVVHGSIGHFRDLEIGVGASVATLFIVKAELRLAGVGSLFRIVRNEDHPDYGKPYLEVPSFWYTD